MPGVPFDAIRVYDREENVRAAQAVGLNGHVFQSQDELAAVIDAWLPAR